MDIFPPLKQVPSPIRRLALPLFCGLVGIVITIMIGNIPHNYSSLILLAFLMIFTIAHILWFHRVIQTLRQDLKSPPDPSKGISHAASPSTEEERNHNTVIEAAFFQRLQDHLNITHSQHIQAQSLQDNKMHLIHTSGLLPLLKDNQLEILAQPIVNLPQKRLSFFYCVPCVTIENGMIINLNTLVGSPNNVLSNQAIDRMILFQTLQFVRRQCSAHPSQGFVCTLSPTLYKDPHCLKEIIEFLHQSHFPLSGLMFEVPLDISDSLINSFSQLKHRGVRFVGKWYNKDPLKELTEFQIPSLDFVMLPYSELMGWIKKKPGCQRIEILQHILEISPQTIISQVNKEQDLYHRLPVPFDFAFGDAFGVAKPLYHIQV